jgi:AraC-like DNA-binding protein
MSRPDYQLLLHSKNENEHIHDYAQILLPLDTSMELHCQGKDYVLHPQELGFVPPNLPHQCLCQNKLIIINIPQNMIKKGDLEILSSKIVVAIEGSLEPLYKLIREEITRNNASMRYLYYYLYDILVDKNSFRSIRYIREHFDESINVAHLASLENYSVAYFNEWFKQQTDCTPYHYLRMFRIEKAKELLSHTDYNLLEIAMQVGYNSNAAFTRAFKAVERVSPAQYRANTNGK